MTHSSFEFAKRKMQYCRRCKQVQEMYFGKELEGKERDFWKCTFCGHRNYEGAAKQ